MQRTSSHLPNHCSNSWQGLCSVLTFKYVSRVLLSFNICLTSFVTFCWSKMYIGHGRLHVCLSVPRHISTLLHGPGRNLGELIRFWCTLVVHYWSDLQSVHGFHCYDNILVCKLIALYTANACNMECEMSASACTRCVAGCTLYLSSAVGCTE